MGALLGSRDGRPHADRQTLSDDPQSGLRAESPGPRSRQISRDHEWMEDIAKRDAGALAALYDRYAPAVLALCARILGRRGEAEDLVSEIFLEI